MSMRASTTPARWAMHVAIYEPEGVGMGLD